MPPTDIAVIGGGPSGAWTAYCLARRRVPVTIIDGSHPREKPCGGGVTGRALALVAQAVPASRLPATPICTARFRHRWSDREPTVLLRPDDLVVATRTDFD